MGAILPGTPDPGEPSPDALGRPSLLPEVYRRLDFILPSRGMAARNPEPPQILRQGLPQRARAYTGERLRGTGGNRPKPSDHCPVVWEVPNL